jgi:hypothetical protein
LLASDQSRRAPVGGSGAGPLYRSRKPVWAFPSIGGSNPPPLSVYSGGFRHVCRELATSGDRRGDPQGRVNAGQPKPPDLGRRSLAVPYATPVGWRGLAPRRGQQLRNRGADRRPEIRPPHDLDRDLERRSVTPEVAGSSPVAPVRRTETISDICRYFGSSVRSGVRHPEPPQGGSRQKNGDQNGDQLSPSGRLRRCRVAPGTRRRRRPAPSCRSTRCSKWSSSGSGRVARILRLLSGPAQRGAWSGAMVRVVGALIRTRLRRPCAATAGLRPAAPGVGRDEQWRASRLARARAAVACVRSAGGTGGRSAASQRGRRCLRPPPAAAMSSRVTHMQLGFAEGVR